MRAVKRLRLAANYLRRQTVLPGGPVEITIESTSRCNLSCPMCPRHIHTFDNRDMDVQLYRKIIEDCKNDVEFIWPYGIGEPLLHPAIFDMIRLAKDAGLHTGISTNATLLDGERGDLLLESGIDYVILAFDGASKQTYEKYRAGAAFEETRETIRRFLRKKQARGLKTYVVLQMVLLQENVCEMDEYRRFWNVPGVDAIRFKRDEVRIEGSRIPEAELRGARRQPCHLLWRGPMYIRYDGLAYPCCYLYDQPAVGDLKTQSLREIWNSAAMVRMREAHARRDLRDYPACATCQAPRPGKATFYGSLALNSLAVRKVVPALEKLALRYNVGIFEKNPG